MLSNKPSGIEKKALLIPHTKLQWLLLLSVLFILALLPFLPSLSYGFIDLDDPHFIIENTLIRNFPSIKFSEIFLKGWGTPYYKPLVYLSWSFDYYMGQGDAWPFHLHNTLLHGANGILVFAISRRFFQYLKISDSLLAALIAFLLFAWHPLKVESVVWAMQRKDLLYSFYYLLAILSYLKARISGNYVFVILSGLSFCLALLSKSMALTLPFVLVLLDLYLFRPRFKILILNQLPILATMVLAMLTYGFFGKITTYFINTAAVEDFGTGATRIISSFGDVGFVNRIAAVCHRLILWMQHIVFPAKLSLVYPLPDFVNGGAVPGIYLAGIALIFLISIASLIAFIKLGSRTGIFVWLSFLLMVSPALAQGGHDTTYASDRFLYLASLSFILPLSVLATNGCSHRLMRLIVVLILLLLGLLAYFQQQYWKNSETLWKHSIRHYSNIPTAYNNLGMIYASQGRWDAAGGYFLEAIRADASDPDYHNNLGIYYAKKNAHREAIDAFRMALMLDSSLVSSWSNMGIALLEVGRNTEAVEAFSQGIFLDSARVDFFVSRAKAYMSLGDSRAALSDFNSALRYNPEDYYAIVGRGMAYTALDSSDQALLDFSKAIDINGSAPLAYVNRGVLYARTELFLQAAEDFQSALAIDPSLANVWYMLAISFKQLGMNAASCEAMKQAAVLEYPQAVLEKSRFCSTN